MCQYTNYSGVEKGVKQYINGPKKVKLYPLPPTVPASARPAAHVQENPNPSYTPTPAPQTVPASTRPTEWVIYTKPHSPQQCRTRRWHAANSTTPTTSETHTASTRPMWVIDKKPHSPQKRRTH